MAIRAELGKIEGNLCVADGLDLHGMVTGTVSVVPGRRLELRGVVALIVELTAYTGEADLGAMLAVEPVAGDDSFLMAMVERLLTSCRHHERPVTEC